MNRMTEGYDKTVKVRVTGEQYDRLIEEAREKEISLSDLLREKFVPQEFVPQNVPKFVPQDPEYLKENREMIGMFNGLTEESFYEQIHDFLLNGEITVYNGELVLRPVGMLDTEKFVEACEEKGLDPYEQFEEAVQRVNVTRTGGAGGA